MSIPIDHDAMVRFMRDVSEDCQRRDNEEAVRTGVLPYAVYQDEQAAEKEREFAAMSHIERRIYLNRPLPSELQVMLDDLREKLVGSMPNIARHR